MKPGTLLNKLQKYPNAREPVISASKKPFTGQEFFEKVGNRKVNVEAIYIQTKGELLR